MITRAHVMPYLGQHVVFHTTDGVVHHGILHSVNHDGIFVRPVGGTTTRLASHSNGRPAADLLKDLPQGSKDAEEVFWPFFFFPFLALAAFSPWWWW